MKRKSIIHEKSLSRGLGAFFGLALLASSCNFTPGLPIPPPPRENFTLVAPELDCRGEYVVQVNAVANTFGAGELAMITNVIKRTGVLAPVSGDGSLQSTAVEAAGGENIAIRRKVEDGEESMPTVCLIPPPTDGRCLTPL
jgi:hypothetical protein